ncbi:SDR family NAD(P)-dependent oxidoreductase [Egicoccus halophilus]|uniref:Serine/threonine protein kinase n=1 Tax=Egicoccus halophilus TaxID=1670830 RepID=A0A8J3ETL2_9ACTN|nr:SDR family NAD(P)-dependent oxidoreductase [Egicoccus halophilus]GGI04149.1 serine/threonine protein kinase [Egicoccus halophilus]
MTDIDLHDRVVIVTGAGGGLGRSHALSLAERGARVVVNDLGGGDGQVPSAAAVVDEIEAAGGTAIAVEASVAERASAEDIVARALDAFGQVDGLVNNAGILRDRSFAKMTEQEVRDVLEVHLLGAFHLTAAVWPHFKEQGFGRIVNTTSPAGLFGNFGQANYASAKMGLVGLTRTLAIEGARAGINVNIVAPLAASRMTETILPPEALEKLDPALVSPLVTWLVAPACGHSGGVFSAGGGFVGRVAVLQGRGVVFDGELRPEDLAERWDEVVDVADAVEFDGGAAQQGDWVLGQV